MEIDRMSMAWIIRDKKTKKASLSVELDGKWRLFAGTAVEKMNDFILVLEGEGSGIHSLQVSDSVRSYFRLETEAGSIILAERHLPMTGGYNFRDLGGYETTDGRLVKWGKILRSDDLHGLSDADLDYLSSIPLVSIVDFRSGQEMEQAPDKVPAGCVDYPYSINPGRMDTADILFDLDDQGANRMMKEINILLVTDSAIVGRYRDFFRLLQNEKDVPLLFHCSAGKDRTGMGAALVLFALGVKEETILEDYLLSNEYLENKYTGYITKYPHLKPLFEVNPEFIQAGMQRIRKEYGSVEEYLEKVLDVDIRRFREMYLY